MEFMTKYFPRFKPQTYLNLLNQMDYFISINKINDEIILNFETLLWKEERTMERIFKGSCIEECLDKAIEQEYALVI